MKKLKTSMSLLLCLVLALCACPRAAADGYTPVPLEIPVNAVGSFTLYEDEALTAAKGTADMTAPGTLLFEGLTAAEPGNYTYYLKAADGFGSEQVYKVVFCVLVDEDDRLSSTARVYAAGSETKTEIRNYELWLLKLDAAKKDGEALPLEGARFELYRDSDVQDGKPKHGASPLQAGFVTDAEGKLRLGDLQAGTYWLRETKAPAGYTRLKSLLRLELGTEGVTVDGKAAEALDENGELLTTGIPAAQRVWQITIENTRGTVMPGTGGSGTALYYLLGAALLAAAAALFLYRKKCRR